MNIKDIKVGHLAQNEVTGNILFVCKNNQAVVVYSRYDYWAGQVYDFDDLEDDYTDLGKITLNYLLADTTKLK